MFVEMEFTEDQIHRYSRHILLKEIGIEGQLKIASAKVLVIGCGGLGSPVALYLAAAGVGMLGLIDADVVDVSNLQRQVLHFTPDIGIPKVISAKEKINKLNPDVQVTCYHELLTKENSLAIISDYDFVLDCTDNFAAKFLINDSCVYLRKPYSHGAILGFEGQTFTYIPESSCYRCIYDEAPPADSAPSCSQAGVLGAIAGMLGTIQAAEALKFITGSGELLTNKLLRFNALTMEFKRLNVLKNDECSVCNDSANANPEFGQYENNVC